MTRSLLMIHGLGCTGQAWGRMRPLFEAAGLACEAPTLFPDKRVSTGPPADLGQLSLDDYIEASAAKAAEMAARMGRKPAVIGHSMGGLIAQMLAARGDVEAAVLLTPASPKDATVFDLRVIRTFWNIFKIGTGKLPGRAVSVGPKGFSYGVLNAVDPERHDEIYAETVHDSGLVCTELAKPPPIDETRVAVPVLTIGAERDRATPIKAVRKVARKYAGAAEPGDYLEYADNAHWIVDEPGTETVTADIITWLARKYP